MKARKYKYRLAFGAVAQPLQGATFLTCFCGKMHATVPEQVGGKTVAVVLCTGVDPALTQTRKLILESAGHTVFTTTNERNVASLCHRHRFDVAVIGQAPSAQVKRQIASVIRQHCPSAKILELYLIHQGKAVPDADSWMETPPETPREFAERVSELAGSGKGKSANR